MSGILGLDGYRYSLRTLTRMARARSIDEWNRTADLMAHLSNLQRTSDSDRIWMRADFHPFLPKPELPRTSNPADI